MQDTVMTIIAIIVAGILLFIFPLLAVSERNNDIANYYSNKGTDISRGLGSFVGDFAGMIAGGIVVLYTVLLEKSSHLRNSFFEEITPLRLIAGLAVFILLGLTVQFMLEK